MRALAELDAYRFATLPIALATLTVRVQALADQLGFRLRQWDQDGLGPASGALLELDSGRVILLCELQHLIETGNGAGPSIEVDAAQVAAHGVEPLLTEALAALRVSPDAVDWTAPSDLREDAIRLTHLRPGADD